MSRGDERTRAATVVSLGDGGPPPRPFTDLSKARAWREAIEREANFAEKESGELARIENIRQQLRDIWERNKENGYREALLDLAHSEGAGDVLRGSTLAEPPPARDWLIQSWLPANRVTILSGNGGTGKSRLALQLAAAVAAGGDWLPMKGDVMVPRLRGGRLAAVIASWEDEGDEFRRQLHGQHGGYPAVDDRLQIVLLGGRGPLWGPPTGANSAAVGDWLAPGKWLMRYCESNDAKLLVIDPLASAYGSNENDRAQVRRFMGSLGDWAERARCAVLVIAHPPKGEAVFSGSTDWHNATRAMWLLGLQKNAAGQRAPCLKLHKSNYSRAGDAFWLAGYPQWKATDEHEAARLWQEAMGNNDEATPTAVNYS